MQYIEFHFSGLYQSICQFDLQQSPFNTVEFTCFLQQVSLGIDLFQLQDQFMNQVDMG